jgi:hypothetical protein
LPPLLPAQRCKQSSGCPFESLISAKEMCEARCTSEPSP